MRALGQVLKVIGYLGGMFTIFYFVIIPLIAGMWSWPPMIIGLVFSAILYTIGSLMRGEIQRIK